MTRRLVMLAGGCASLLAMQGAWALDAPGSHVILTVTGAISAKNKGDSAAFSLAMLDALPQATIKTSTPWSSAPVTFTGPRLKDVMAAIGASGSRLKLTALDDYLSTMPFSDIDTTGVLLATRIDGKPIPITSHGPLMTIFDFDGNAQFRNETYYSRSVWQICKMEVIK